MGDLRAILIFDCDGVLVDSEAIANQVFAEHLQSLGWSWTLAECQERFRGRSLSDCSHLLGERGLVLPPGFFTALQDETFARFRRLLQPVPGIERALQALPYPKCVASSGGYDKLACSLECTGLGGYFNGHVYSADSVARGKPAPDLFLYACARMGVTPDHALVIEDAAVGVEAALAAGSGVLWYTDAGSDSIPEHLAGVPRFQDMAQLPSLVSQWIQGMKRCSGGTT